MKGLITGEGLWKTYNLDSTEVHALRGLNISVDEGEFVSIMGPSGSGKSTLLNMIGGLDTPTQGDLFIDGKNISSMNDGELTRMRAENIGYIFQTFNLLPALSVRDNVGFPMRNLTGDKKMNKSSRIKRAEELHRDCRSFTPDKLPPLQALWRRKTEGCHCPCPG